MEFSRNGQEILQQLEGFKAAPYKDSTGKWTIGYGVVIGMGPDGHFTIPYVSQAQAAQLLMEHMQPVENVLNTVVAVPLTQNQFDALCMFVYNIGVTEFENSTLLKLLNTGDYAGASGQFPRWIFAHGLEVQGLVNRRETEQKLFNTKGI